MDAVAITSGCRDDERGLAGDGARGRGANQALGRDIQQGADLDDHPLGKVLQGAQPDQIRAGLNDQFQTPTAHLDLADLRVGTDGHGQTGEETHPRQFGLGAVVVDVVGTDGLDLGRIARLASAQNDADRVVVEFIANPADQLQPGIFRLHDHVEQNDRHRGIGGENGARLAGRIGLEKEE